jgi:tetratricopeptide (TPR) repeat protein/Zn-dependent protease
MNCVGCLRANLPGGVRCDYCGAPFPVAPKFDLGIGVEGPGTAPGTPTPPKARRSAAGWLAAFLLLAFKGKSLLGLLKLQSVLPTLISMAVFVGFKSQQFGWRLALGFTVCILVHELGHVVMNLRHGLKFRPPMFIPFVGALIFVKDFPDDPTVESECGAGGPAAGLFASLICCGLDALTGDPFWNTLAFLNFGLNLFNLVPFAFLDGARIGWALGPANWNALLLGLLLVVLKFPSGVLWVLLLVMFFVRLGKGDRGRHEQAAPATRIRMTALYLGLCLGLATGLELTRPEPPPAAAAAKPAGISAPATTDPSPTQPTSSPEARSRFQEVARLVITAVVWLLWLVGWPAVCALLAAAAREPFGKPGLALTAWMVGGLAAIHGGAYVVQGAGNPAFRVSGAVLFAAPALVIVVALVYGISAAVRAGGAPFPRPRHLLTWGCLACCEATLLITAYWLGSGQVLLVALLAPGLFFVRRPWLIWCLLADLAARQGDLARAIDFRTRALSLGPDATPGFAQEVQRAVHLNALNQGTAALASLDAASARNLPAQAAGVLPATLGANRALARLEQGEFTEALRECELLLAGANTDPVGAIRLHQVQGILLRLALYRGWFDQAIARAEHLLGELGPTRAGVRSGHGPLLRARAWALVESGTATEAESAIRAAAPESKEPAAAAMLARLRAMLALRQGHPDEAERLLSPAVAALPTCLEIRYWRAAVVSALGRQEEARLALAALATSHPDDYWGTCARQKLDSGSRPGAPSAVEREQRAAGHAEGVKE